MLIFHREMGFEGDEVSLMFLDILFQFLRRMLTGERVWVVAVGQEQHLDVHALSQQHVGTAHGGMDTSLVTVVE